MCGFSFLRGSHMIFSICRVLQHLLPSQWKLHKLVFHSRRFLGFSLTPCLCGCLVWDNFVCVYVTCTCVCVCGRLRWNGLTDYSSSDPQIIPLRFAGQWIRDTVRKQRKIELMHVTRITHLNFPFQHLSPFLQCAWGFTDSWLLFWMLWFIYWWQKINVDS